MGQNWMFTLIISIKTLKSTVLYKHKYHTFMLLLFYIMAHSVLPYVCDDLKNLQLNTCLLWNTNYSINNILAKWLGLVAIRGLYVFFVFHTQYFNIQGPIWKCKSTILWVYVFIIDIQKDLAPNGLSLLQKP